MNELKYLPNIEVNGTRCYCYQSVMQHLKLSLHINGLKRRMGKYPAQFCIVSGRHYVSGAYAQLLIDFRKLYKTRETIKVKSL